MVTRLWRHRYLPTLNDVVSKSHAIAMETAILNLRFEDEIWGNQRIMEQADL